MARTLVLIRHAKTKKTHPLGDHARKLAERGVVDGQALGRWLQEEQLLADLVLVSTATRTLQTTEQLIAGAGAGDVEVRPERALYDGGSTGALETVREAPEDVRTLWVVGHEPTMSTLALALADEARSSAGALDSVRKHLATAAAAVLLVEVAWSDLAPGLARLETVHTARG
ncbi:phosphohistidine phosphatase [Raineyella antarctica]|uniref:Phosphohistidine phosphatase n=1 Tax=Raineyella antarctica TaxID=1577474 RepID=A0A1G6I748_9ACTN|nr:histidine phosphatase family protein [Raineyella antarctica]SDC02258.1 phosphohistidine phosphatase [Raineyella antarctica]